MSTYLLTWNPQHWPWKDFDREYRSARKIGYLDSQWSCGVTRRIKTGDRVFLMRLGQEPKGIMAAGVATSEPFTAEHFSLKGKIARYITARFDVLLDPESEILPREKLNKEKLANVRWNPQASGTSIQSEAAVELEKVWRVHLASLGLEAYRGADEVMPGEKFWEGALHRVFVNAYERDPRARAACIAHYGARCSVCGIDFGETFGEIARGFIHVHHLQQLSDIKEGYSVDPIADLRPLCPNCHAVIHKRSPPLTIEEMRNLRRQSHIGNS